MDLNEAKKSSQPVILSERHTRARGRGDRREQVIKSLQGEQEGCMRQSFVGKNHEAKSSRGQAGVFGHEGVVSSGVCRYAYAAGLAAWRGGDLEKN